MPEIPGLDLTSANLTVACGSAGAALGGATGSLLAGLLCRRRGGPAGKMDRARAAAGPQWHPLGSEPDRPR